MAKVSGRDTLSVAFRFAMAWSAHAHLRLVLETLMGRDHPSAHRIATFV